jgi:hypothetical protein
MANIGDSKAVANSDELRSLNLFWQDIYARLLERDDDYWTNTTTFSSLAAYATANPNEYKIPLPADFYRLRFVDYMGWGALWRDMHKFPLSMRNDQPPTPYYRFDGNYLWVVGVSLTQVRIHYYIPPATLTEPEDDLQYAPAVAPNNFSLIAAPAWGETAAGVDYGLYVYNLLNLLSGSVKNNTAGAPVTLFTAATTVTNVVYYKGYLYWLRAADIWRAPTDFVSAIAGGTIVQVTVTGNVTSFSIFNDTIYYSPGATIKTCTLTGGTITSIYTTSAGSSMCLCNGNVFCVIGGVLKYITGLTTAVTLLSGITAAATDGVNLYVLDTTRKLRKVSFTSVVIPTILVDAVLREDVQSIGAWYAGRIPVLLNEGQKDLAISDQIDYDITYPSNVPIEIMALQLAIDFCTKLGRDITALKVRLGDPDVTPTTGAWASFKRLVKRDDYEPERIKNSRSPNYGMGMM